MGRRMDFLSPAGLMWHVAIMRGCLFILFISAASVLAGPNLVWIIGDDLSPDLRCYGEEAVNTPNIDALANQGRRYTAAFATSPVCSPSRSALITGVYQTSIGAHHHRTIAKKALPAGVVPITQHLRNAGYQCINFRDETIGSSGKTDFNFKATDVFDQEAWDPTNPFFLMVNFSEPHRPFRTSGKIRENARIPPMYPGEHPVIQSDWAAYLEVIERLDNKVGRFLEWLDQAGQAENTVVFFFGDHGRPHVWDKQWLYDGGIRVPLIVRWPGEVEAGSVDDRLVSLLDVSKETVALALADVESGMPQQLRGQRFLSPEAPRRREIFAARDRCGDAYDRIRCVRTERFKYIRNFYPELPYWQTSRYKLTGYPAFAVLKEWYAAGKLHGTQARFFADTKPAEELYDLEADPHETTNLASDTQYGETLIALRARLETWIHETGDQGATPEGMDHYRAAVAGSTKHFKGFQPDAWHERSEAIRARLVERELRPLLDRKASPLGEPH